MKTNTQIAKELKKLKKKKIKRKIVGKYQNKLNEYKKDQEYYFIQLPNI